MELGYKHTLERMMTPYGVAWCCSTCHGLMINFALFKSKIDAKYTKDLWVLAMKGKTAEIKCPQCNSEMNEVVKYNGDSSVEMNICRKCQTIWFTEENWTKASEVFPVEQKKQDNLPGDIEKMLAIEQVKNISVVFIGANGGISGVLLFYCLMFPQKPMLARFGRSVFQVPAIAYGIIWFGLQIYGLFSQNTSENIVWFLIHIGGAIVGILMWAFLRNDREHKYIKDE